MILCIIQFVNFMDCLDIIQCSLTQTCNHLKCSSGSIDEPGKPYADQIIICS